MADAQVGSGNAKNSWWRRLLEVEASRLVHPRLPVHLSILAMLLTLPALWVGFQVDDYTHRVIMLGLDNILHPGSYGFLNVFSFLNGDPAVNSFLRDMGILPWWASSHLRISFLRYLSAFSMWIDYKLWPNWPSLMHLQSIGWYAALVAATTVLYRRFLGLTVAAGLAALFYAVDVSHAEPVSWLANRHALLAVFFGVLCLLSYDRWRREGQGRHGVMSAVYFALALLSGEMALATAAYLFAYALFLDRDRWSRRFTALWPCALVFVAWVIIYLICGFGTHGTGFYVDPVGSPAAFVKAFATRAPLLLMGQWSHIWAESAGVTLSQKAALIFTAVLIVLLALMLFSLVRKDRVARFWLMGMLLSLVPVAGASQSNRLLGFAGLGAMGLLAQFIVHLKRNDGVLPSSHFWRIPAFIVAAYLIMVRLLISPITMPLSIYGMSVFGDTFINAARLIPDDSRISRQDLILVNPPITYSSWFIMQLRLLEEKALPARVRQLSEGGPVAIYRMDEYTLLVGTLRGSFGYNRSLEEDPIKVNQEFRVPGMAVRVTQVGKDGPEVMVYRFSVPLEDPSLKWLQWKNWAYKPFVPPAIGKSVSLSQ